ncbi:MAG: hypothetical protein KJO69_07720 [Gammaproteobacteria bacterium]|nr:hypothetical protein [Gammaproteobacteria bacterium]
MQNNDILQYLADELKQKDTLDRDDLCQLLAVLCITILRGSKGNEFVSDFLRAAESDNLGLIPKSH